MTAREKVQQANDRLHTAKSVALAAKKNAAAKAAEAKAALADLKVRAKEAREQYRAQVTAAKAAAAEARAAMKGPSLAAEFRAVLENAGMSGHSTKSAAITMDQRAGTIKKSTPTYVNGYIQILRACGMIEKSGKCFRFTPAATIFMAANAPSTD